ncbi:hypothetical protein EWM64_g348 [Hericium alpestre]|uniref:Uncharacterized protein n=1 Tax=Hericium alpestre TaxID=135208 RepID=A0A4Z0AAB0_9AGAM|nr:hypothetical protein EWM64_g348 [Hericium alpestre]
MAGGSDSKPMLTRAPKGKKKNDVLKLTGATSKKTADFLIYEKLYWPELKEKIDEAYHNHLNDTPTEKQVAEVTFRNSMCAELFAAVPQDVKEHVWKVQRGEIDTSNDEEEGLTEEECKRHAVARKYQAAIDLLPGTVAVMLQEVKEQTGLKGTFMFGGPHPKEGGAIISFTVSTGQDDGRSLVHYVSNFKETFEAEFRKYLRHIFSPAVCQERSLLNIEVKTSNQGTPAPQQVEQAGGLGQSSTQPPLGEKPQDDFALHSIEGADGEGAEGKGADGEGTHDEGAEDSESDGAEEESEAQPSRPVNEYLLQWERNIQAQKVLLVELGLDKPLIEPKPKKTWKRTPKGIQKPSHVSPRINSGSSTTESVLSIPTEKTTDKPSSAAGMDVDKESQSVTGQVTQQSHQDSTSTTSQSTSQDSSTNVKVTTLAAAPTNAPKIDAPPLGQEGASDVPITPEIHVPASSTSLPTSTTPSPCNPSSETCVGEGSISTRPFLSSVATDQTLKPASPLPPPDKNINNSPDTPSPAPEVNSKKSADTPMDADEEHRSGSQLEPRDKHEEVNWPQWFRDDYNHLKRVSDLEDWQALVAAWATTEQKLRFETGQEKHFLLNTKARPSSVGTWVSRGRLFSKPPDLGTFAECTASWHRWWISLQPEWHGKSWPLTRTGGPVHEPWTETLKGSRNRFEMVLITLSW